MYMHTHTQGNTCRVCGGGRGGTTKRTGPLSLKMQPPVWGKRFLQAPVPPKCPLEQVLSHSHTGPTPPPPPAQHAGKPQEGNSFPGRQAVGAGAGVTPGAASVNRDMCLSRAPLGPSCWGSGREWEVDSSSPTPQHPASCWPPLPYLQARAAQGHRPRRQTSHSPGWPPKLLQRPRGNGGGGLRRHPPTKATRAEGHSHWGWTQERGTQDLACCTLPQPINNAPGVRGSRTNLG